MKTTLAIAGDVLRELKKIARATDRPMTEVANEVLRLGLSAMRTPARRQMPYRESPVDMGEPRVDLTKSLALISQIDDEEAVREYQLRK